MKKIQLILITIFTAVAAVFSMNAFAAGAIDGSYEGWYYANQGQTGLTLTIDGEEGVFEFYNMPGRTNAKDGSYTVKVTESNGTVKITGVQWIERPSSYSFVTLSGTIDGDTYTGLVDGRSSWEFVLTKNNDSYQNISDSIFNNHRYEIVDTSLTWHEAQEECEKKGGHLAVITSEEEQRFIEKLLEKGEKKQYWLGANSESGVFEWVTDEVFGFTNWDKKEPNKSKRKDNCKEQYLQIYNEKNPYVNSSKRFCWNDIFYDNVYPGEEKFFSTKHIGYICEWETWSDSAEWATEEMEKASENGLIPDVLIGKNMTQPITRGEFAAVCVRLFESLAGGRAVMSSECTFEDIYDNENRNYILKAYNIGAVNGFSATEYCPNELISREQLATMLTRVYKRYANPEWTLAQDAMYTLDYSGVAAFADDAEISDYAKPSVYFMVKHKVISGIGNNKFAPKNITDTQQAMGYANATREQALVMSLRAFEKLK